MRGDIERIGTFFVEAVEKVNSRINVLIEVYLDHIEGLDGRAIPSSPFVGVQFLMKGLCGTTQESRGKEVLFNETISISASKRIAKIIKLRMTSKISR